MKLPPLSWYHVLLAAVICFTFCAIYSVYGLPWYFVLQSGCSGLVLARMAGIMCRDAGAETCWEFGRCNGRVARRHKKTGVVEFMLWKAGERVGNQVRKENVWCAFEPGWWPDFVTGTSACRTSSAPLAEPSGQSVSARTS